MLNPTYVLLDGTNAVANFHAFFPAMSVQVSRDWLWLNGCTHTNNSPVLLMANLSVMYRLVAMSLVMIPVSRYGT